MAQSLVIEFSAGAVERIRGLMDRFGETSPEAMIMRGLGLLEAVVPYMIDRQITILDYGASDERRYVDLVFDDAEPAPSEQRAA